MGAVARRSLRLPEPTYYTVSEARFFAGTAALLNSLRLTGNIGDIVVIDHGLTSGQRKRLMRHAQVVDASTEQVAHPLLLKPFAAALDPSGIVVLIDSDMIIVRSLEWVVERAAAGQICLFPDPRPTRERWFAEWADVLELGAPLRRQPYLNAGFVALSVERWPGLLSRWRALCQLIPADQVFAEDVTKPFWAGDQDVLNALLASEVPPDAIAELPEPGEVYREDLAAVRIADARTLACSLDGEPVTVLHYSLGHKAWQSDAWLRLRDDAYVRLLPRLLFADDVPLRLAPKEVPFWLRPRRAARLFVRGVGTVQRPARAAVSALPESARRRFVTGLRRRAPHQQSDAPT
jgi:hypothetical protein